jgi:hypothetical protein
MTNIPRCHHIKTDGRRCGSPSLKSKRYCYFHYEVNRAVAHLDIPPLEDGDSIQLALTDLARALVEERIGLKPAALLAYILQTASANLKHVHLGVFPDRMITELPDLDPWARGLAPLPGERNRDPELSSHPEPGASSLSRVEVEPPLRASEPVGETLSEAEGATLRPPAQVREGRIRSALSAPKASASSALKAFDPPGAGARTQHKLNAAKAGSLKDATALLRMLKSVG